MKYTLLTLLLIGGLLAGCLDEPDYPEIPFIEFTSQQYRLAHNPNHHRHPQKRKPTLLYSPNRWGFLLG